ELPRSGALHLRRAHRHRAGGAPGEVPRPPPRRRCQGPRPCGGCPLLRVGGEAVRGAGILRAGAGDRPSQPRAPAALLGAAPAGELTMKSYLLSTLLPELDLRDEAAFSRANPHPWLLREPTAWHPTHPAGGRTLLAPPPPPPPAQGAAPATAPPPAGRPSPDPPPAPR